MEIIQNPGMPILGLLLFCVGLTAITYIAIILFLDLEPQKEPVKLPPKR